MRRRSLSMRRSELKRKSGMKNSRPRSRPPLTRLPAQFFREAAQAQRVCAVTGSTGKWDAHHVVEAAWLRRNAPDSVFDQRNALRLLKRVHERHTNAYQRVPLVALRAENIAFAFDVMGPAAYDYLKRHYSGEDPRIEAALEVTHAAA